MSDAAMPETGTARFPKRARKSVEKFEPDILMNFQKTEKSRSKAKDKARKQVERTDIKEEKSANSAEDNSSNSAGNSSKQ